MEPDASVDVTTSILLEASQALDAIAFDVHHRYEDLANGGVDPDAIQFLVDVRSTLDYWSARLIDAILPQAGLAMRLLSAEDIERIVDGFYTP